MDNLLNSTKDFEAIKKYLEAINQTTDDFLYMFDILNNNLRIFGDINKVFRIDDGEHKMRTFEEILAIVHPADRAALCADIEKLRRGAKDSHNIDFRMFNIKREIVWVNSRGKVLHNENGEPHIMIGRLSEEALRHLYNPMTALWNKTKLREDLKYRLYAAKGWLMMLEIPNLIDINLVRGREFGNQLLREIADILESFELVEKAYHIDHNNFAAIIRACDQDTAEAMYEKICEEVKEKCFIAGGIVPIDNSIFIDASQLIDSAKITLRNAVENPNGRAFFFSAEDIGKRISELTLLEELKESVQNDFAGFEVYYQPQIKSETYELHGVEALLRYSSPKRGRVFPDEFIPILEQTGLIDPVGMWVLGEALRKCKEWRKSIPTLQVAVNFSSIQFDDYRIADKIFDALKAADLPGSALTVELTESIRLSENKHYYNLIKEIKSYGVRFSIDDFGTGYSNLGYLKYLDVNEIKIDRSFVSEVEKNTYNYRLISNLIEFAKTNSIHACLEGIETAKELTILEPLRADFFQGYLFDRPCTADEIAKKYINTQAVEYRSRERAIDELCRFKERFGSIHFDPKNILHANNIGLWIIRVDEKNNRYDLHADGVMERVLGIDEKTSSSACYDYWHSRISPDFVEYVDNSINCMINSGRAVQLEYRWEHPELGEVSVRSSGIRTSESNGIVILEGYHRTLTGVEGIGQAVTMEKEDDGSEIHKNNTK